MNEIIDRIQITLINKYTFLELKDEEFAFLFNETWGGGLYPDDSNINEKELIKSFVKNLKKYILGGFNFEGSKKFLGNYLDKIIGGEDSFLDLQIVVDFFSEMKLNLDIDILLKIIEDNENLRLTLQNVVNDNIDKIKEDKIEEIHEDDMFIQFIDVYCAFAGISEDCEEEIEIDESALDNVSPEKYFLLLVRSKKVLSCEEEQELFKRLSEGEENAKNILVEHNLRLVLKIACKYVVPGLTLMDLFNEGSIGLMKAIDRFDYKKRFKLSTYATWWIRQAITRSIADKGANIRIPVHVNEKLNKYRIAYNRLYSLYSREPTVIELANELNWSVETVKKIIEVPDANVSLNRKVGDEEDTELGDILSSDDISLEDNFESLNLSDELKELLIKTKLKPKEIEVLTYRMGLDGKGERTLETIGRMFGVTRERIRQIESRAIKKLRRSQHTKAFAIYMDNPEQALKNIKDVSMIGYSSKIKIEEKPKEKKEEKKENIKRVTDYIIEPVIIKEEKKVTKEIKKEKRVRKSFDNVYDYFGDDYGTEQVDMMLEEMVKNPRDSQVMHKKWGDDFRNPVLGELTKEEKDYLYGSILPRMKTKLKNIKAGKFVRTNANADVLNKPTETLEKPVQNNSDEVKPVDITPQYHSKILEIFNLPEFIELTRVMPYKDSIIIALRLGYVDGKCFSVASIANFFGFAPEEVLEVSKNGIGVLKNRLNEMIDEEIEKIDSNGTTLVYNLTNNGK